MDINHVFSDFIGTSNLSLDNNKLYTEMATILGDNVQESISLHSPNNSLTLQLLIKEVESSFFNISKEVYRLADPYHVVLHSAWVNIDNAEPIVEPHEHAGFHLSAVYYVKATENKSKLTFMTTNPRIADKYPSTKENCVIDTFNEFNSSRLNVPSKEGLLLVFPSWLTHYVTNWDNDPRMSIAFNGLLNT